MGVRDASQHTVRACAAASSVPSEPEARACSQACTAATARLAAGAHGPLPPLRLVVDRRFSTHRRNLGAERVRLRLPTHKWHADPSRRSPRGRPAGSFACLLACAPGAARIGGSGPVAGVAPRRKGFRRGRAQSHHFARSASCPPASHARAPRRARSAGCACQRVKSNTCRCETWHTGPRGTPSETPPPCRTE
jgi:hypothetical protein